MRNLWAKADKDKKCVTRAGQGKVHVFLNSNQVCVCGERKRSK